MMISSELVNTHKEQHCRALGTLLFWIVVAIFLLSTLPLQIPLSSWTRRYIINIHTSILSTLTSGKVLFARCLLTGFKAISRDILETRMWTWSYGLSVSWLLTDPFTTLGAFWMYNPFVLHQRQLPNAAESRLGCASSDLEGILIQTALSAGLPILKTLMIAFVSILGLFFNGG